MIKMKLKSKKDVKAVMDSLVCFELNCQEPSTYYILEDNVWLCDRHCMKWLGVEV